MSKVLDVLLTSSSSSGATSPDASLLCHRLAAPRPSVAGGASDERPRRMTIKYDDDDGLGGRGLLLCRYERWDSRTWVWR